MEMLHKKEREMILKKIVIEKKNNDMIENN
jgi:hypothetical protein